MCLRRSEAAGIRAGAISRGRPCKFQGCAGSLVAAGGVSGPSSMMSGWARQLWVPRARFGVALGSAKGGRAARTQSPGWTHQRLVVEGGTSRLAVAAFIRLMRPHSRCQLAPAAAGMSQVSRASIGLDGVPAAADAHTATASTRYVGTRRWGLAVGTSVRKQPPHN